MVATQHMLCTILRLLHLRRTGLSSCVCARFNQINSMIESNLMFYWCLFHWIKCRRECECERIFIATNPQNRHTRISLSKRECAAIFSSHYFFYCLFSSSRVVAMKRTIMVVRVCWCVCLCFSVRNESEICCFRCDFIICPSQHKSMPPGHVFVSRLLQRNTNNRSRPLCMCLLVRYIYYSILVWQHQQQLLQCFFGLIHTKNQCASLKTQAEHIVLVQDFWKEIISYACVFRDIITLWQTPCVRNRVVLEKLFIGFFLLRLLDFSCCKWRKSSTEANECVMSK